VVFLVELSCWAHWSCWAHCPRSSTADGSRLLVLDPLGQSVLLCDCLHALSCCLTRLTPRNVEFSFLPLLQWPGPGMSDFQPMGTAVLISSEHNASDLVMIHMISVKYAFSLSSCLVVCVHSARVASVFAGQGLNQPGQRPLTDTVRSHGCRLMNWHRKR
jgi:hypothetical protein